MTTATRTNTQPQEPVAQGGIHDLPKVLLFLSREVLTDVQRDYLGDVLASQIDIDFLLHQCEQRLIAPIALTHMIDLAGELFPDRVETWKATRRGFVAIAMRLFFEAARFHEACLSKAVSRHVFFKGPSLATQYYRTAAFRTCRDLDVLIPPTQLAGLVARATASGYSIASRPYDSVAHRGQEALVAYVSMNDVVTLRSPQGVIIELHKTLDRNSGLFDTEHFLRNAELLDFFGREIRVPPPEALFCYVVYHSTQHTWARLNWFTDVHAILSREGFDRGSCMQFAERLGLGRIVAACIELDDWCSAGARTTGDLGDGALALYEMFVDNIQGGLQREKEIILQEHGFGLPHRFQAAGHTRRRVLLSHIAQAFSPDFETYSRYPMKPSLWWIYGLMRPPSSLIGLIKSRMLSARRKA
jgi:hypothetical protein